MVGICSSGSPRCFSRRSRTRSASATASSTSVAYRLIRTRPVPAPGRGVSSGTAREDVLRAHAGRVRRGAAMVLATSRMLASLRHAVVRKLGSPSWPGATGKES